jgi:hypothetical protein
MRRFFAVVIFLVGCGDSLFQAGHTCESSEECADGLLCDYGQMPHVCAGMSSTSTDLSSSVDEGAVDAGTQDLANADFSMPPDLSSVPDLSQAD